MSIKKDTGGALIAMSGGVDSSVAALLTLERLRSKYEECLGVTMKLFHGKNGNSHIGDDDGDENSRDAASICANLGIVHETLDFTAEFRQYVIEKFIRTYESGATPNPCIDCNKNLKFGRLLDAAHERGLSEIVTGHYARVEFDAARGRWLLKRGLDLSRDQSYVLYSLTQEQLAHTHFPLGEFRSKGEVRTLAEAHGFVNAHRRDSQDICFIPDGDYAGFLERHSGRGCTPGNFIDESGKILGCHKGIVCYTIGQRKGLGIAAKSPLYVKAIDVKSNSIVLTANESELFTRTVFVCATNFISVPEPELGQSIRVTARLRYRQQDQPAIATMVPVQEFAREYAGSGNLLRLDFDEPQRAPARGQAAVLYDFYQSDIVVGGGTIL